MSADLNAYLAESSEELRGYLRSSLEDIVVVAQKGLEALDAGELPIAVADRLLREANSIQRNTDRLVTYAEIAEAYGIDAK